MAASERSEEGAGVEVGGEAEARRMGGDAWRRRCINDGGDDGGRRTAALVDAPVERPAAAEAAAVTRIAAGVRRECGKRSANVTSVQREKKNGNSIFLYFFFRCSERVHFR